MSDAQKLILEALRRSLPPFDGFDHSCVVAAVEVDKALGGLTLESETCRDGVDHVVRVWHRWTSKWLAAS